MGSPRFRQVKEPAPGLRTRAPLSQDSAHPSSRPRAAPPELRNRFLKGLKPTQGSDHKAPICLCASGSSTQAKLKGTKGLAPLAPAPAGCLALGFQHLSLLPALCSNKASPATPSPAQAETWPESPLFPIPPWAAQGLEAGRRRR